MPALDALQGLVGGGERTVAGEEEEFGGDAVPFEGLDAHDEEEACEDTLGDEVEDDEEGSAHGAEGEEALGEIGDALFDYVVDDAGGVAFGWAGFVRVGDLAGDA